MLPFSIVDGPEQKATPGIKLATGDLLGAEVGSSMPAQGGLIMQITYNRPQHLDAPFTYIKSLPSKGVRDTLADALNIWTDLPEEMVERIKGVVGDSHAASLMHVTPEHRNNNGDG
jgi:hypothetical protein